MLLCVAGTIFSPRWAFVRGLASNNGFTIVKYKDDFVEPEEVAGLEVRSFDRKEDVDAFLLSNWNERYAMLLRDAEDWHFLSQRPGRALVYIEMPGVYRQCHARSYGSQEIRSTILSGFKRPIARILEHAVDRLIKVWPETWWMVLDEIFEYCSPRKVARFLEEGDCNESLESITARILEMCRYDGDILAHSELRMLSEKVFCVPDEAAVSHLLEHNLDIGELLQLRPSWDQYFLDIAKIVSKRSNCVMKSGCVVVNREGRILATGHSGTPSGTKSCLHGGCERCLTDGIKYYSTETCFCIHAIQSALLYTGRRAVSRNCTIYCLAYPCIGCSKVIIQCDISRVVYQCSLDSEDRAPHDILMMSGISVERAHVPEQFFWCVQS